jgi:high-affinity iron transporter
VIAAAIIVLREVVEAALVIGIVLAATRGIPRRNLFVTGGVVSGVIGALFVAGGADALAAAFEGVGQEVFNATVLLAATAMLGWHNVWMKRHGAELARSVNAAGHSVATGARPLTVLLVVVGLAVLREGSEVVLFLYGIAAGGTAANSMFAGGLLGLVGGVAIGALMYFGLLRIPARHLFNVTGALLLLLAAGMASQAAGFLVQAGYLAPLGDPLWDTSALLPVQSVAGQVLHALMGYVDRPSGMQVLWFFTVAVGIAALMWRVGRPRPALATPTRAIATLVLVACLATLPAPRVEAAHTVYSPIVEQGELAVELRSHRDFDSRAEVDGSQQLKAEFEYTPTSFWRAELLGEWEQDGGGSLAATEVAWENVFQLTPQGKYWLDLGLVAEYAHSLEHDGNDALELGLLAEKQFERTVLTANFLAEREFAGGAETALEYAARYRWRLAEAFEPGVELYGELGDWGDNGSFESHEHQFGPSLLGKFRTTGRSAWKYEAAVLFGLTQESPDTTVRLQLEYEF